MPAIGDRAARTERAAAHTAPRAPVQASVVRALDVPARLLASWFSLHERALEQNPFFEPACVLAAAHHLPDGDRIELLLAHDDSTVFGCMPLQSLSRWHWSPRRTTTTRVRRLTWLGTPLLDRTRADEAMAAMLGRLRDRRRATGHQLLAIEWMHTAGPVAGVLRRAAQRTGLPLALGERFERPGFLRLPAGAPGGTPGGAPEPVRRQHTIHQKRRRLSERQGWAEFVDRSGDPAAVDEFVALESSGYKGRNRVALAAWPGEPEWFVEMCAGFAADGRTLATALVAGDRTVADMVAVTAGDEVFLCVSAYDEEFAAYSPGIQLHYDTIDALARTHLRRIDTCTYAGNATLARIYPDRIPVATVLVGLGSPVERVLLAALPTVQRARRQVRAGPAARLGSSPPRTVTPCASPWPAPTRGR